MITDGLPRSSTGYASVPVDISNGGQIPPMEMQGGFQEALLNNQTGREGL